LRALLAALLLAATAAAEESLAIFEPLVGDQWVSSSKLPDGQEVRSRTVWTWGAGKRCVRMRQFVLGDQGEIQRYETIVAFDRAKKKLVYLVFSEAGLLSRGTARAEAGGVVLEQPALESFPAMRTAYAVGEGDECTVHISFKGKEGWKQRIESKLRRTKIGSYKKLELDLCPACQRIFVREPLRFHPEQAAEPPEIDIDAFLRSLGYGGGKDAE